jgi:hypothetical protein
LPFRPRGGAPLAAWRWRRSDPLSDGFAKYQPAETPEDYRHRMTMNLLALVFTVMLVLVGVWLTDKIVEIRKNQDCVLSGRNNCNPIEVRPARRD